MRKLSLVIMCILLFNVGTYSQRKNSTQKKHTSKTTVKKYTEEQALEYIADWYQFYNADEEYCCPSVRRISNNVFYVKVEYANKNVAYKEVTHYNYTTDTETGEIKSNPTYKLEKNEFFWSSKVLILTIQSNGKYSVREKFQY